MTRTANPNIVVPPLDQNGEVAKVFKDFKKGKNVTVPAIDNPSTQAPGFIPDPQEVKAALQAFDKLMPEKPTAPSDTDAKLAAALETISRLTAELESNAPGEARGIVWTDLYKIIEVKYDDGTAHKKVMHKAITARSYVSLEAANSQLRAFVTEAARDGWFPYQP